MSYSDTQYSLPGRVYFAHSHLPYGKSEAYAHEKHTYAGERLGSGLVSPLADSFLSEGRPITQFVDDAGGIEHFVRDAFHALMGRPFPANIVVRVSRADELREMHERMCGGTADGLLGFALNRHPGQSEVFVMQNSLDSIMLVVGHELGHVLSPLSGDRLTEEAKAFAFQAAWAGCIRENNIAGLGYCFSGQLQPAANGLHDAAQNYVARKIRYEEPLSVFYRLASNTQNFSPFMMCSSLLLR